MSLSVRGITKRFGDLVANRSVSLELAPGSLHAVLGENGAGKSTLMKILAGTLRPDQGTVSLDGKLIPLGSPRAALAAGVGMLAQEPLVCLPFTVRENFRLGSSWSIGDATELLVTESRRLGFRLDPHAVARSLSIGERQQLEMVRLLAQGIEVLILDEPTSGLTGPQRTLLFDALRKLADEGLIVVFVSHKLEEVNDLCRSVTIMRRGEVVAETTLPRSEADLVQLMFGETAPTALRAPAGSDGSLVAELIGLTASTGRQTVAGVDLSIHSGEVIGIAGLEGSGQGALLRSLAGLAGSMKGRVRIGERDLSGKSPSRYRDAGVAFLPGGRLEEGLVPGLSIAEHLELADGRRRLIDWNVARERAHVTIGHFRIKGSPHRAVEELSGGNQQRLLLALLPPHPSLVVLEHPTRGLDLDSAAYLWTRLLERRRQGTAIVFASSDLDEILLYSDRVLVVFDGRVIAERPAENLTVEGLGTLMAGLAA